MADDLTLAEKRELLKDLKTARYSGAKRIRFRERDVTYRTDEEMVRAITDLETEIGNETGRKTRHVVLATFRGIR